MTNNLIEESAPTGVNSWSGEDSAKLMNHFDKTDIGYKKTGSKFKFTEPYSMKHAIELSHLKHKMRVHFDPIDESIELDESKKRIGEYSHGSNTTKVYKLTGAHDEGDPYVVQLHKNGKHYEPADYFTNDEEDAHGTAKHMVKEKVELDERDSLTPTIGSSKITHGMPKIDKILATHELKAKIKKRIKFDSKLHPKWAQPNMQFAESINVVLDESFKDYVESESIVNLIESMCDSDTLASSSQIDSIMREKINEKVAVKRKEVAKSVGNIGIALKDKNIHVRMAAAKHPNATPENLKQAINDTHPHVRLAALSNPNLDKSDEDTEKDAANTKTKETIIKHLGKLK